MASMLAAVELTEVAGHALLYQAEGKSRVEGGGADISIHK